MIQVKLFAFNDFQENTYILYDDTKEAIVIDPGCYYPAEQETLKNFIKEKDLKVVDLINTHCHIDHVLGNQFIKDQYQVKLKIHPVEEPYLAAVKTYAPNYGFIQYKEAQPDDFLEEGAVVSFGQSELEVLFVPGHAPGHIALYHPNQKIVIGGDVLFKQSIGRTDLPGGNFNQLIESIKTKFFPLADDVVVYTGHGPSTTIGEEKQTNPFLQDSI